MKKLFAEKPLVHYTVVLTIVAIVCGLVIGGVNAITAPIIEQNIIEQREAAYREVFPDAVGFNELEILPEDPDAIINKVEALDADNQVIGYIYEAEGSNKYGTMRIVAAINFGGTVEKAKFTIVEQTYKPRTEAVLQEYVGKQIDADFRSGATIVFTTATIQEIMNNIAIAHANTAEAPAFTDPYDIMFNSDINRTLDNTFTATETVLSKEVVTDNQQNELGFIYKLSATAQYNDEEVESGSIAVYVGVDQNGEILGVYLPTDEYHHSSSSFYYDGVVNYANTFVGLNLLDSNFATPDLTAGPSNSKHLVADLITDLKEVLQG